MKKAIITGGNKVMLVRDCERPVDAPRRVPTMSNVNRLPTIDEVRHLVSAIPEEETFTFGDYIGYPLETAGPHIGAVDPHIGAADPHIEAAGPHIGAAGPHIGAVDPHIEAVGSHIEAAEPHIEAAGPHIGAAGPHIGAVGTRRGASTANLPMYDLLEAVGVREAWAMLPEEDYVAVTKLAELLNWNREQRFCPADGTPLRRTGEISKTCPCCGKEYFPLLSPAIVVLVTRGEKALLVHARTLKPDVMALVAGFVETGESLEECVRREIREETSLEVDDVRYFGSQSWPYPHQLMIGFTARYKSGEIRFADGELTAGGFFTRDNLPLLPTLPSLSRQIIDAWVGTRHGASTCTAQ